MKARPVLIAWQDHVAGLAFTRTSPFDHVGHRDRLFAFAIAFSHTCRGMTGDGCWVPPSLLKRVPKRTAYRYLRALVDHGLVIQTTVARPGQAARYRLVVPENACHDDAGSWHTSTTSELAHVRVQRKGRDVARARTTRVNSEHGSGTGGRPPVPRALWAVAA